MSQIANQNVRQNARGCREVVSAPAAELHVSKLVTRLRTYCTSNADVFGIHHAFVASGCHRVPINVSELKRGPNEDF
jgi:hypothetical protein